MLEELFGIIETEWHELLIIDINLFFQDASTHLQIAINLGKGVKIKFIYILLNKILDKIVPKPLGPLDHNQMNVIGMNNNAPPLKDLNQLQLGELSQLDLILSLQQLKHLTDMLLGLGIVQDLLV